jgi:hypothetical protein
LKIRATNNVKKHMKARISFTLCGALLLLPLPLIAEPTVETVPAAKVTPATAPAGKKMSSGLDDIMKLSKAGVDDTVILSFVRNSRVAYNPTVDDVIQLREAGISSQVISSLMERGETLRQTAILAYNKNQEVAAAAVQSSVVSAQNTTYSTPTTYSSPVIPAPVTYVTQQPVVVPAPSTVTYIGGHTFFNRPVGSYCPPVYSNYRTYSSYPRYSVGIRIGGGYYGRKHCW